MLWKRGLLLAAIHVVVAIAMILVDREELHRIPDISQMHAAASLRLAAWQEEEQTVSFSPCALYSKQSPPEVIVTMASPFVEEVIGWAEFCPASWTLAGRLGLTSRCGSESNPTLLAGLCTLISLQWSLIGFFPLIHPKRWWLEPGAFITVCTSVGAAICLIPAIDGLARVPALFALLAWLWLLSALFGRALQFTWRLILAGWRRVTASAA